MNWRAKPKSRGWEWGHDFILGYLFIKANNIEEYEQNWEQHRIYAREIENLGYTLDEFFDLDDEEIDKLVASVRGNTSGETNGSDR